MELQIQKEKINIKKRIGEKRKVIEIEKDIILPDNKPDIIRVQSDNSNIYINKKENMENKCKIDGGVETRVSYLTGEGKSRVLKIEETFTEIFEIQGLTENSYTNETIAIKSSNITILNERKIHYKIEIVCVVKASTREEIEFISQIGQENNLQTLTQKQTISTFIAHSESKVSIKENVEIGDTQENIEVIKFNYEIRNVEKKTSYNKVLIKTDCMLKFLYQVESGKIFSTQKEVPLMGFLDVENVEEGNDINIEFMTKNLNISEDDTKRGINIEMELNISGDVCQNRNIELLSDLYDLNCRTDFTKQKVLIDCCNRNPIQSNTVEQKNVIEDINQIYDSQYQILGIEKKAQTLEINIKAVYIYSSFENENVNKREETFKIQLRLEKDIEEMTVRIADSRTNILPDSSVNTGLDIEIFDNSLEEVDLINEININEEENDDGYSMIIYFVKPGDTLWTIAKRFRSTMAEITRINEIENENRINVGDKLYIPRAV